MTVTDNLYKYKITGLPAVGTTNVGGVTYTGMITYTVTETQVDSYNEPKYYNYNTDSGTWGEYENAPAAGNQGKISNEITIVTLPETGGFGTMPFRLAGVVMVIVAFAGILLNKRRRRT